MPAVPKLPRRHTYGGTNTTGVGTATDPSFQSLARCFSQNRKPKDLRAWFDSKRRHDNQPPISPMEVNDS